LINSWNTIAILSEE